MPERPKFEIRERKFEGREYDEVFRNGEPLQMGDGPACVSRSSMCSFHGKTAHLVGYNQGGHDRVELCLKCARELLENGADCPTDSWNKTLGTYWPRGQAKLSIVR